jgi:CTP:molybdopterin cytidylyltransferase MocA
MISAIFLAAGSSGRMGRPKALLEYNNSTFIDHILSCLKSAGCKPIVTVLGRHADIILEKSSAAGEEYVINEHPERGMFSSIQLGMKSLPAETNGTLIVLTDHPAVLQTTYDALAAQAVSNPGKIIIPQLKNRHGHPVYIGRKFFEQFLNAADSLTARDIIHKNRDYVQYLEINDPGILKDIDYPEDLKKL